MSSISIAALFVAVLACVSARDEVSVRLHIVSYESGGECSEGDGGLTGASISAQYRVGSRSKGQLVIGEWKVLTEIDPRKGFNGHLVLPSLQSSVAGVQLRLLQLEHGGGSCNCWRVEEALLMWGRSNKSILQQTHCSTILPSRVLFCGDSDSSPREFVSETVQQETEKGISLFIECPKHHAGRKILNLSKRIRRSSNDNSINVSLNLASQESRGVCYGGKTAGLGKTTLRLEYRSQLPGGAYEIQWTQVEEMNNISLNSGNFSASVPVSPAAQQCVEFRLVQEEHGGGYCNCWSVENIQVQNSVGTITRSNSETMLMCLTRASVRRILTCTYCNNISIVCTNTQTNSDPPLRTPFNISVSSDPISSNAFSETRPRLHIFFQVIYRGNGNCDRIEHDRNEAIEFSLSFDDKLWIPITVIHGNGAPPSLPLGNFSNLVIRDYQVENQVLTDINDQSVSLELYNFVRIPQFIQLRWLQTSFVNGRFPNTTRDFWGLDDLRISYIEENGEKIVILSDSFNDELNSTVWPIEGRRDARVSTMCTGENQALTFGLNTVNYGAPAYFSRSIMTASIFTGFILTDATTTLQDEMTTSTQENDTATPSFTEQTQATLSPLQVATARVQDTINDDSELMEVADANPLEAVILLSNLSASTEPPDPAVSLYLLGDILNRYNLTVEGIKDQEMLVEGILEIGENIISNMPNNQSLFGDPEVVGSSLLSLVDRLALEVFPETGNISTGNISIQTAVISNEIEAGYFTTISSMQIDNDSPLQSIEIHSDLIRMFANSSFENFGEVRVISTLINNTDDFFPSGRPGIDNSKLGSGIISTSLQCGDVLCDTQSIQLENPVIITIQHMTKTSVDCVFWEFFNESSENNSLLTRGQWSNDNCSKNMKLSDNSLTVCECTHLTHFAVLLSPVELNDFPEGVTLSLEVISFVGVAISLVAMAITIITFIFLRSLHNMRNYIHINLCINLMIAQLIFIVGIDRSADDHVPVHCQAIAALLHYFFLVSFMWMLMEGVVLYIVLVVVFVKKTKYYMIGFTLASYGIPLLYMGLTLPLGLALNTQHYGTTSFCFLDPATHFIWAFIAPVIVIILINFVLFLIVARVMWKHQKRRTDKSKVDNVKRWLRSAVFLVIIMGLTWIMGVLVLEVEALLPLTYIFTIMVACQGLFIFIIFVIFSKQVREAYKKWAKAKVAESTVFSRLLGDSYTTESSSGRNGKKSYSGDELKDSNFVNGKPKEEHVQESSVMVENTYATEKPREEHVQESSVIAENTYVNVMY